MEKKKCFCKLLHFSVVGHNEDNVSSITIMKNILKGRDQKKLIQILMEKAKLCKEEKMQQTMLGSLNFSVTIILI